MRHWTNSADNLKKPNEELPLPVSPLRGTFEWQGSMPPLLPRTDIEATTNYEAGICFQQFPHRLENYLVTLWVPLTINSK